MRSSNFFPFSDKGEKGKFYFFPFPNFSLPSLTIYLFYLFFSVKWLTFIAYCPRVPCPWEYLLSYSPEGSLPDDQIETKSPGSRQFCGHFTNVTILQQCGISSCCIFFGVTPIWCADCALRTLLARSSQRRKMGVEIPYFQVPVKLVC